MPPPVYSDLLAITAGYDVILDPVPATERWVIREVGIVGTFTDVPTNTVQMAFQGSVSWFSETITGEAGKQWCIRWQGRMVVTSGLRLQLVAIDPCLWTVSGYRFPVPGTD